MLFLSAIASLAFAGQLEITWLDVNQGDAQLIKFPDGETMLVDAGPTGKGREVVLPYLQSQGISHLDYVVNSHFHSDHFGGLDEVLAVIPATTCFDRGLDQVPSTTAYRQYEAAVKNCRKTATINQVLQVGEVTVTFTSVDGFISQPGNTFIKMEGLDENDRSVSFLLQYKNFRYWTGGDIGGGGIGSENAESRLAPALGHVDVLKVSHHGSASASNQDFVSSTHPLDVVVSCGDGNRYNHPAAASVVRWEVSGAKVYQTDDCYYKTSATVVADKAVKLVSGGLGFAIYTE